MENKTKTPTFNGKKLRKLGPKTYESGPISLSSWGDMRWDAVLNLKGRDPQGSGDIYFCATERSPQKALDKLHRRAFHAFKKLARALDYDVEE